MLLRRVCYLRKEFRWKRVIHCMPCSWLNGSEPTCLGNPPSDRNIHNSVEGADCSTWALSEPWASLEEARFGGTRSRTASMSIASVRHLSKYAAETYWLSKKHARAIPADTKSTAVATRVSSKWGSVGVGALLHAAIGLGTLVLRRNLLGCTGDDQDQASLSCNR
jgi:hypothetical protein